MRLVAILGVTLVLALAAAWILLHGDRSAERFCEESIAAPSAAPEAEDGAPARTDLTTAPATAPPDGSVRPATSASEPGARLTVKVRDALTREAVAGARVM